MSEAEQASAQMVASPDNVIKDAELALRGWTTGEKQRPRPQSSWQPLVLKTASNIAAPRSIDILGLPSSALHPVKHLFNEVQRLIRAVNQKIRNLKRFIREVKQMRAICFKSPYIAGKWKHVSGNLFDSHRNASAH
ncbi:hypothetical protein [Dongia sp.]|uniref:hypothetical protein n=1 Tax=Dongia sp. TaxID=1977262 RepID=UPI0035B2D412